MLERLTMRPILLVEIAVAALAPGGAWAQDVREAVAASSALQIPQFTEARFVENWEGAFVYEGTVHDHITFRIVENIFCLCRQHLRWN